MSTQKDATTDLRKLVEHVRQRFNTGISCEEIGCNATLWTELMDFYLSHTAPSAEPAPPPTDHIWDEACTQKEPNPFEPDETPEQQWQIIDRLIRENVDKRMSTQKDATTMGTEKCPRCSSDDRTKRSFVQDDEDCRTWYECNYVWHDAPSAEPAPAPTECKDCGYALGDGYVHPFKSNEGRRCDHRLQRAGQPTAAPEDATTCPRCKSPFKNRRQLVYPGERGNTNDHTVVCSDTWHTVTPEDATTGQICKCDHSIEDHSYETSGLLKPDCSQCACKAFDATTGAREQFDIIRDIERDWPYGNLAMLRSFLNAAYSAGQANCTAHTQVYERVQALEKMYREADDERRELRNRVVVLEPQAEALEGELAAASEQEKGLREALRSLCNGHNGGHGCTCAGCTALAEGK